MGLYFQNLNHIIIYIQIKMMYNTVMFAMVLPLLDLHCGKNNSTCESVEVKVNSTETKIGGVETAVRNVEGAVRNVDGTVNSILKKTDSMEPNVTEIHAKVTALKSDFGPKS